jgi:hypothetical protein
MASMSATSQALFAASGPAQRRIVELFTNLPPTVDQTSLEQQFQDPVRYWMHHTYPTIFPTGAALIPIDQVLRVILDADHPLCSTRLVCEACTCAFDIGQLYYFPFILDNTTHDAYHRIRRSSPRIHPALGNTLITRQIDFGEWILSGTMLALDLRSRHSFAPTCPACLGSGPFRPFATALSAPQIISFDISNFAVQPQLQFSFSAPNGQADIVYHLSAVLYFGDAHFTSRYIDASGCCWAYDGQRHGGMMFSEGLATSIDLASFHNRRPSALLFLRVS